jgi:hypothetical protein
MMVPSLRIARAPMRPETASKVLVVRPTWTIGLGPWPLQAPPRVAPGGAACGRAAACFAAFVRSVAAWSSVIGSSPESSRLQ